MDYWFVLIINLIYFCWLTFFIFKIKNLDIESENIDNEIKDMVEKKYVDIISFEKCKNFTRALQKNLRHQLDSVVIIVENRDEIIWEYLDCIKDTVDLNDMTFDVGNKAVNSLLRKKVRECYYKKIMLDVVSDLSEINIESSHLFLIFSDIIDIAIKHIENARKDQNLKTKIIIRSSRGNLKSSSFFVMQIAYDIIDDRLEDIEPNNRYHQQMMNLLLIYHNGIIVSNEKDGKIVKTITIQLMDNKNHRKLDYIAESL